jgi:hypothetical protein
MKNFLLTSVAVLSLISTSAFAQEATSGSNSGATSGSISGVINGGSSANNGGVTVGPIDASSGPVTSTSDSNANSGSVANSISGGGTSSSDAHASGGSATGGTSSATANPNASNQGNAQNITFNSTAPSKQTLKTTPTVYAPALTTTLTETCMGSTSGGISVLGVGGTLGTTWNDTQCVRRLNAREMAQTLGDRDAARALLCQDKDVAAAYAAVGQSCFLPVIAQQMAPAPYSEPAAAPPPQAAPVPPEDKKPTTFKGMDPIPNPVDGEKG